MVLSKKPVCFDYGRESVSLYGEFSSKPQVQEKIRIINIDRAHRLPQGFPGSMDEDLIEMIEDVLLLPRCRYHISRE